MPIENLKYQDPSRVRTDGFENMKYELNSTPPKGKCCVIANGVQCTLKKKSRGFCSTHYQKFDRHGVLDKFSK